MNIEVSAEEVVDWIAEYIPGTKSARVPPKAHRKRFVQLFRSPKQARVLTSSATVRSFGSGCTKFEGMRLQRMVNEVRYGERLWPHL